MHLLELCVKEQKLNKHLFMSAKRKLRGHEKLFLIPNFHQNVMMAIKFEDRKSADD